MKKFLSVLLAVMMVLSSVSFAAPTAVGTYEAAVEAPAYVPAEEAELAGDYDGEYGEIVFSIDFESAAAGEIDLSSGVAITELGATVNPDYSVDGLKLKSNYTSSEIYDDATNYLGYYGVAGTDGLLSVVSENGGLTEKTGVYVLTFDVDYVANSGTATYGVITSFAAESTLNSAVQDAGVEIWPDSANEYSFRTVVSRSEDLTNVGSIANVDTIKISGNTGVAADDEFYIDNITLYYVSDTATVTIEMGDMGDDVVVENYPTKGLTVSELAAYIPYVEGYAVSGFSSTEGGDALASLAVGGDTTLYPIWKEASVYGELVAEINFDKTFGNAEADGTYSFDGENKYMSLLGGSTTDLATISNFKLMNGASTEQELSATIKERSEGDYYMYLTTNIAGANNMLQFCTLDYAEYFKNDEAGYLVLTYDLLWPEGTTGVFNKIAFNESQARENNVEGTIYAEAGGDWGSVVTYYESASIGKSGTGGNATTITSTEQINVIKIQAQSTTVIGDSFGIDNIRLYWKPLTAKLTIKNSAEDVVIENYPTDGMSTLELSALLPTVEGKEFAGFSYTDGGELLSDTRIARDSVFYAVYNEKVFLEYGLEFNDTADFTAMNTYGGTRAHAASHASYWSDNTADGYVTYNAVASEANIADNVTSGNYLYAFVHDAGYELPYTKMGNTIAAGSFEEFEIRLRYSFDNALPEDLLSSTEKLYYWNAKHGNEHSITPSSVYFPARFYVFPSATELSSTLLTKKSMAEVNNEWFTLRFTAEQLKADANDLTGMRFDLDLPHGTTIDVDYIRFITTKTDADEEEKVECGYCGGEHETEDCPDVCDKCGEYGCTETNWCDTCSSHDHAAADCPELEEDTGDTSEWLGEYGELLWEVNFDSVTAGTEDEYTLSNYSNMLGNFGKLNPNHLIANAGHFIQAHGGDTSNFKPATYSFLEDDDHGTYIEYTGSTENPYYTLWIYGGSSTKYITDKEGYFILTYDVLLPEGYSGTPHKIVFHHDSKVEEVGTYISYPAGGAWGEVVYVYDARTLGSDSRWASNSLTASNTLINQVKFHNVVTAGNAIAMDNVRLWWVPKTVSVTVAAGNNTGVSAQTFTVVPTETTVADLIEMVDGGEMTLAGVSLTEGGELLSSDALLSFAQNTTLYPTWKGKTSVVVDMGDNTTATPVEMIVTETTTVADVIAKIVDHGDKKLTGLSRTENGDALATTELIAATEEVTTLYAVWEDYEYLKYYSVEFDGDFHKFSVQQNYNDGKTYKVENGVLSLISTAPSGYTASRDHQVKVSTFASNVLPADVVTGIAVRMRYVNIPETATSYISNRNGGTTETFNPVKCNAWIHSWNASGTHTGGYDRMEYNLVDGQWFTRIIDATTAKMTGGISNFRFDTTYPLPDGAMVEYDFIRFLGDNENELIPETAVEPELMPNFSTEFDEGNDGFGFVSWRMADENTGAVTGFYCEPANIVGGGSAYKENTDGYMVWNEEGYVTLNFDASETVKAAAEAAGATAGVYDAQAHFSAFDETVCLDIGAIDKVQMRMRFRGIPSETTSLYCNKLNGDAVTQNFTPASPFYFHVVNDTDSIGTSGEIKSLSFSSSYVIYGSVTDSEWFIVEFDGSYFRNDTMVLDTLRLDLCDAMPDGSKLDVDYIRFYGVEDVIESVGAEEVPDEPVVDKEAGAGDEIRATYSLEFNEDATGASLVSWMNEDGTYMVDDGVNGDKGPGIGSAYLTDGAEGYVTWNTDDDGTAYATLNYVASDEIKAAAEERGALAAVYDASVYVGTLDGAAYLEAGSFDEIKIRMRLRGFPEDDTAIYGQNYGGLTNASFSLTTYPVYFHWMNSTEAVKYTGVQSSKLTSDCTYTEGSYVRDEWFEITIPASFFDADTETLATLRINAPDWAPDGAKIDIDYIRFINTDADYSPAIKNEVGLRVTDPVGIRFKAEISGFTNEVAEEYGWVAADAEKVAEADLLVGGTNVLVGYGREEGVDVKKFFEETDELKTFTLVITNITSAYADRQLSVKPFVKVDGEYVYGDAITKSVKDIAQALIDADAELAEDDENKLSADVLAYLYEITATP